MLQQAVAAAAAATNGHTVGYHTQAQSSSVSPTVQQHDNGAGVGEKENGGEFIELLIL